MTNDKLLLNGIKGEFEKLCILSDEKVLSFVWNILLQSPWILLITNQYLKACQTSLLLLVSLIKSNTKATNRAYH